MTNWADEILQAVEIRREQRGGALPDTNGGVIVLPVGETVGTLSASVSAGESVIGPAGEAAGRGADTDTLRELYRKAAEGAAGSGAGQYAAVVHRESGPVFAGLSAEELDREICRDSRRYDGGMTIF